MTKEKCAACRFFKASEQEGHPDNWEGDCRRNAPVNTHWMFRQTLLLVADIHHHLYGGKDTAFSKDMDLEGDTPRTVEWPLVIGSEWCGQFEKARIIKKK